MLAIIFLKYNYYYIQHVRLKIDRLNNTNIIMTLVTTSLKNGFKWTLLLLKLYFGEQKILIPGT
jgi:hypothetical protein